MQTRRKFLTMLTAGIVALVVAAAPVIADELIGVLTKVDVEAKTLTVEEKGSGKEVQIKTTNDTELVTKKGTTKLNLKQVAKGLEKLQEKGRKGRQVTITHENGVASKVDLTKKKAAN
jgi:hypothetical protein